MSQFRYTGRDAQGGKISGSRESASVDSLASELLAEKITPLQIEEQAAQRRRCTCHAQGSAAAEKSRAG